MKVPVFKLHDGTEVPQIGFGTAGIRGSEGTEAIVHALNSGYRYLDSAYNYENEATVGKAIKESGVERSEILVASKLPGRYHQRKDALTAIEEGLYRSGLDYFDIYLIHWPNPIQDHYLEAWQTLLEARDKGLIRHVGVSNFLPEHIDRLIAETGEKPVLNQIEQHPYFQQADQRAYHEKHGILTQSWSPLGRYNTKFETPVAELPAITELAEKYDRTPAQIVLRWHIQLGSMPIPKSSTPKRQKENLDVFGFELSEDDVARIAEYDRPDGRNKDQDPAVYEEF